jgi:hypothetical protein
MPFSISHRQILPPTSLFLCSQSCRNEPQYFFPTSSVHSGETSSDGLSLNYRIMSLSESRLSFPPNRAIISSWYLVHPTTDEKPSPMVGGAIGPWPIPASDWYERRTCPRSGKETAPPRSQVVIDVSTILSHINSDKSSRLLCMASVVSLSPCIAKLDCFEEADKDVEGGILVSVSSEWLIRSPRRLGRLR